MTLATSVQL